MDQRSTNQVPNSLRRPETDDYRAASQATATEEYEEYSKHAKAYTAPRHRLRKLLIILLVVVLLGSAGAGVYLLLNRKDTTNNATKNTSNSRSASTDTTPKASTITTTTEHYVSNGFMLEFDYPKDWVVNEPTTGGVLTVKSPALSLKDASGKAFNGQVVLTIRSKQQALPEFDKGNAVATIASQKINYTKPSQAQRGATYLSFLTYASSGQSTGLDGVYITGDVGYQKGQAIPKADFTPVDPVISVTFAKCTGGCGADATAASIDANMWQDETFGKPLTSMLESLTIN